MNKIFDKDATSLTSPPAILMIELLYIAAPSQPALDQRMAAIDVALGFANLGVRTRSATVLSIIPGIAGVRPGTAATGFPPAVIENGQTYEWMGFGLTICPRLLNIPEVEFV